MLTECQHVRGDRTGQDACPTVRHSAWSNAKPTHEGTRSRLKPTKIKTVKKCPECVLRGSSKTLLREAGPLPSPPPGGMCCRITQESAVLTQCSESWNGARSRTRDGKTSLHCSSPRVLLLPTSNLQSVNKARTCLPRSCRCLWSILKEGRVMKAAGDAENVLNLPLVWH